MSEILSYSSLPDRATLKDRLAKLLATTPTWLLAILLLLPALFLRFVSFGGTFGGHLDQVYRVVPFLSFAALFIAGAVQRFNWRDTLIMTAVAGLWTAGEAKASAWLYLTPFPYSFAVWAATPIAVVGVAEWFLVRTRAVKSLFWIFGLSLAVGCSIPLITKPLEFTDTQLWIPGFGGSRSGTSWGTVIFWPLLVTLTWIAVPAALRLGQHGRRSGQVIATALSLTSIALFCVFFDSLIYPLAQKSLLGGGPFGRASAASILETRINRTDQEAIWTSLQLADWSKPEDYESQDYRKLYINALAGQDRKSAAQRLSEFLQKKPSKVLAGFCAQLFAEEHRYETVPLLMRYALQGDDNCSAALETMRIPQVALAIIRRSSVYDRLAPLTADFPVRSENREHLTRLLGKDAGPNLSDWTAYYDSMAKQFSTPLSDEVASETQRVVRAIESFWNASGRLYEAKCRLFVRRLEENGNGKYVDQMTATESLLKGQRNLTDADLGGIDASKLPIIEGYKQTAFSDMTVPQPDWNVIATAGLEREVQIYVERVNAMIANYRPATTAPAELGDNAYP